MTLSDDPNSDGGHTYTASELNGMTIASIKDLAASLGYTITKSVKSDIIAEFLAQQEG